MDRRSSPISLLGDTSVDTDGNTVVDIFSRKAFEGELKYEGTNEIGPQMGISFTEGRVQARQEPQPDCGRVGQYRNEGEALANDLGKFGAWTVREHAVRS